MLSQGNDYNLLMLAVCYSQPKTVQPKPGTEEKGQIVQTESPVHHSNVMHWSKEQKVRSRIKHQCVGLPHCIQPA